MIWKRLAYAVQIYRFAALCLAGCILRDDAPAVMPVAAVNGFLKDRSGLPVAGACLRLVSGHSVVSGPDGWFRLGLTPGMDSVIRIYHPDFQDTTLSQENLKTGTETTMGVIRLRSRFAVIKGSVFGARGERLRGAAISVESQDIFALSGGNAEFTLSKVLPGDLKIYFCQGESGWGDSALAVIPDSIYAGINLQEKFPGGGISGEVTDTAGSPVRGAKVRLQRVLETLTDDKGFFAFGHVPSRYDSRIEVETPFGRVQRSGIRPQENSLLALGPLSARPEALPTSARLDPVDVLDAGSEAIVLFVTGVSEPGNPILEYVWSWRKGASFDTVTKEGRMKVRSILVDSVVQVFARLVDSSHSDTASLRVIRVLRHPPVFSGALATAPGSLRLVNLGDTLSETIRASDPDGGRVSLTFTSSDSSLAFSGDSLLRFLTSKADSLRISGLLLAVDETSDSSWLPILLGINRPPVLRTSSPVLSVGVAFSIPLSIQDPEGDKVSVTLFAGEPGVLKDTIFQWTPMLKDTAVKEIRFLLEDSYGAKQEGILPVLVQH